MNNVLDLYIFYSFECGVIAALLAIGAGFYRAIFEFKGSVSDQYCCISYGFILSPFFFVAGSAVLLTFTFGLLMHLTVKLINKLPKQIIQARN